ncbi:glycosyltransferase family 9 protein [Acidobacteriota bacterium]
MERNRLLLSRDISEAPMDLDFAGINKILTIRIDRIGDLLCTTPALKSLRAAMPAARLTLVSSPRNADVLRGWPGVNEHRIFDLSWSRKKKKGFADELRRCKFDLAIVFSSKTDAYYLAWKSGAPVRAGLVYTRRVLPRILTPFWLTHTKLMGVEEALKRGAGIPHEVEQMLEIIKQIGIPSLDSPLDVPLNGADRQWARDLAVKYVGQSRLVGVHLSPKWLSEGWSTSDMCLLIDSLLKKMPACSFLLTFGPDDTETARELSDQLDASLLPGAPDSIGSGGSIDRKKKRLVLAGGFPFGKWTALLSCCEAVISQDTGSLHLASALGLPVVAVYSRSNFALNSAQWAPWKVPHRIVKMGEAVRTAQEILKAAGDLLPMKTD